VPTSGPKYINKLLSLAGGAKVRPADLFPRLYQVFTDCQVRARQSNSQIPAP
jgi:hypothetical protein